MASLLVPATVFVFDTVAFSLAVVAEQRRSHATEVPDPEKLYNHCVYDSDISTGLGIGALLFLLASQILITVVTRCLCCGRPLRRGGMRTCAVLFFVLSWITFAVAEACLLAGSIRNAYHTRFRGIWQMEPLNCETVRKGIFGAGAAFTFFTGVLTILYYNTYSKASNHSGGGAYREASVDLETFR